jgi:hypothetical protein
LIPVVESFPDKERTIEAVSVSLTGLRLSLDVAFVVRVNKVQGRMKRQAMHFSSRRFGTIKGGESKGASQVLPACCGGCGYAMVGARWV